MTRFISTSILMVVVLAFAPIWKPRAGGDPPSKGSRPQSLAVSPDGNTVLTTSMGSGFVTQIKNSTITHIDVGSPSWGVCILNNTKAIVTHPYSSELTILTRSSASGSFAVDPGSPPQVPKYCTEVIRSPVGNCVFVANRGAPPSGAQPWQHSVLEIDTVTGETTRIIATEREPRALAVSYDGTRLFVGHVQGALGEQGQGTVPAGFDKSPPIYDGGSVVMYAIQGGGVAPVYRFPIGSPVRGLAIWPPLGAPSQTQSTPEYRLFISHAGDGAQSEAPGRGGRAIPNVISSVVLRRADHLPLSRHNAVFRHDPDYDPTSEQPIAAADLPAVVHDRLTIAWKKQGPNYTWQLWVANAGSGTASLVTLNPTNGSIPVDPIPLDITQAPGESFKIITSKGPDGRIDNTPSLTANATAANATIQFDRIPASSQWHVNVDLEAHRQDPLGLAFSANPTDLEFDPVGDRILVATHFDHQLVDIDIPSGGIPTGRTYIYLLDGPDPVIEEERNFFTFGRGFDFREPQEAKVQTQACITCHVDGHIDGKVRHTVVLNRGLQGNNTTDSKLARPTAVPSVFDVGLTEWIFFEGIRTIRDGVEGDPGCNSIYCDDTQIFSDTDLFTNAVQSPPSPYYGASLSPAQEWGRYYFQKMNCTRCHGGTPQSPFGRTNPVGQPEIELEPLGPLPQAVLGSHSRLLHDFTQSFLSNIEDGPSSPFIHPPGPTGDNVSFRNMTVVGTRGNDPDPIFIRGVNVPALAGAWDNGPYFHDGRYPTLEAVLDHTWLKPEDDYRAAPLFTNAQGSVHSPADNAYNSILITAAAPGALPGTQFHEFQTHAPSSVDGRISATSWLDSQPPIPSGESARQAVLAFLRVVSSQTELCEDIEVTDFHASFPGGCTQTRLQWSTSAASECKVDLLLQGTPVGTYFTPVGELHILYVPTVGGTAYSARITINMTTMPLANSPICGNPPTVETFAFTTTSCPPPCHPPNCPELEGTETAFGTITALFAPSPNPVQAETRIVFSLAEPGPVQIRIFDLQGREVRTLVDDGLPQGIHSVDWDRRSRSGARVSAGIYYMRMLTDGFQDQQKIILLP